jgi:ABC-2 type transport system permease protein
MRLDKIIIIMQKEFDEIMKNRMIIGTLLLMPLIFAIIVPMAMVAPIALSANAFSSSDITNYVNLLPGASGESPQVALIRYFTSAIMPMFMMLPAMLPIVISAYSIIGEKRNRTLEPLLAAPITEYDIMIGKTLSAIIPALIATWISAILLFVITAGVTYAGMHRILIPDPYLWGIGMLLMAPVLAFLAVMCTVIISSRVNDPRVAQQISALFLLPVMGVFIIQISGIFLMSDRMVLVLAVIVFALDILALRIGKALFEREEILTRWK